MKISSIIVSIVLLFFGNGFTCFEASQIYFADGYNGSSYIGSDSEIVNYFSKEDNEIKIEGALPKYSNEGVNYNTCANVAGTIILGYFDKDNNDLIPNFQASRLIRDKLIYTAQTEAVQNVIDCLYTKMSTNVGGVGTTIENFKAGLQSYVLEKNSDIQYLSLMDEEGINVNLYKNSIDDEKPSVFFVSNYTLLSLQGIIETNGQDQYIKSYFSGNHVLVGYGIREINYFDEVGNIIQQKILLLAGTGYEQDQCAYILLDERIDIVDCYKVNIF